MLDSLPVPPWNGNFINFKFFYFDRFPHSGQFCILMSSKIHLKADGFTAIKSWVIGKLNCMEPNLFLVTACIVFVFGAMAEYSGILLLLKLEKMNMKPIQAYFQVDSFSHKFAKIVYWTFYLEKQHKMNFMLFIFYRLSSLIVIGRCTAQGPPPVRDSPGPTLPFSASSRSCS